MGYRHRRESRGDRGFVSCEMSRRGVVIAIVASPQRKRKGTDRYLPFILADRVVRVFVSWKHHVGLRCCHSGDLGLCVLIAHPFDSPALS